MKNKNNQLLVLSFKIFVHIITSYINIITDIIMLSFLVNRVCNNTLVTFLDGRNTCDNVVIAGMVEKGDPVPGDGDPGDPGDLGNPGDPGDLGDLGDPRDPVSIFSYLQKLKLF